jgi:hypothetical protein
MRKYCRHILVKKDKPTLNVNLGKARREFIFDLAEKHNRSGSFIIQKILDQFRAGKLNLDFLEQYTLTENGV